VRDVREDILARLLAVVATVPNIKTAQRNNVDIPEELLPAVAVFDGDEETTGADDRSARPAGRPYVARMTPQIVVAEIHDGTTSALGAFRREIISRVLNDATLVAHVGGNGAIRYAGCQTDFGQAREQFNQMSVQFMFQYSLKIEEL
jgi:hypothetical protein